MPKPEPERPRFKHDMRIKPGGKKIQTAPVTRPCGRPDCPKEGSHRVPAARDRLNEHLWFCQEHARDHNEHWDYFAGMTDAEIQAFKIDAMTGHRPTWKMGKRGARMRNGQDSHALGREHLGDVADDVAERPEARRPVRQLTRLQLIALETLHLEPTATLLEAKARYKELVKRFHPDANGGDRGAEERLKQVIKAFGTLRASGLT
jgi:hypothetical protein